MASVSCSTDEVLALDIVLKTDHGALHALAGGEAEQRRVEVTLSVGAARAERGDFGGVEVVGTRWRGAGWR